MLLMGCILMVIGALGAVVHLAAPAHTQPLVVQCSLELFQEDVRNSLELYDTLSRELRTLDGDAFTFPDHYARLQKRRAAVESTLAVYETQLRDSLRLLDPDM